MVVEKFHCANSNRSLHILAYIVVLRAQRASFNNDNCCNPYLLLWPNVLGKFLRAI